VFGTEYKPNNSFSTLDIKSLIFSVLLRERSFCVGLFVEVAIVYIFNDDTNIIKLIEQNKKVSLL
jgi:hypothetical protein